MSIRKICHTFASEIRSRFRRTLIPQVFHRQIAYVAASLDPSTRTLQARIETNNPGEKLKKDMFVVATVNAGTIKNAIALPDPPFCATTKINLLFMQRTLPTSLADAR